MSREQAVQIELLLLMLQAAVGVAIVLLKLEVLDVHVELGNVLGGEIGTGGTRAETGGGRCCHRSRQRLTIARLVDRVARTTAADVTSAIAAAVGRVEQRLYSRVYLLLRVVIRRAG